VSIAIQPENTISFEVIAVHERWDDRERVGRRVGNEVGERGLE
jgi:hypothetical protein